MHNVVRTFLVSTITSLVLIPVIIKIDHRFKIYDKPNNRSTHIKPTPLLGGVAISFSSIISILLFCTIVGFETKMNIVVGLLAIVSVGAVDDIKSISAKFRLIFVSLLSCLMAYGFMHVYFRWDALIDSVIVQSVFFVAIIIWSTGITNSINLIDGLDGLAACISIASLIGFSSVFYLQNRWDFAMILSIAALGAVIGYLPYNKYKAKIFMGDAGSMFLGYYMSALSIIMVAKMDSILCIVIPIYFLFIPIMDTFTSIVRRVVMKKSPFSADKMHFHHLLNDKCGTVNAVLILGGAQLIFVTIGLIIYYFRIYALGWLLLILFVAIISIISSKFYIRNTKSTTLKGCKEEVA